MKEIVRIPGHDVVNDDDFDVDVDVSHSMHAINNNYQIMWDDVLENGVHVSSSLDFYFYSSFLFSSLLRTNRTAQRSAFESSCFVFIRHVIWLLIWHTHPKPLYTAQNVQEKSVRKWIYSWQNLCWEPKHVSQTCTKSHKPKRTEYYCTPLQQQHDPEKKN